MNQINTVNVCLLTVITYQRVYSDTLKVHLKKVINKLII